MLQSVIVLEEQPDEATQATMTQNTQRFAEQARDLVAGPPTIEEWDVVEHF